MNSRVTPDQIAAYRNDGYVALEGFLSHEELAELREAVDEGAERIARHRVAGNGEVPEPEGHRETVVVQRVNLWKISPVVRSYVLNEELGRMLCELAGIPGIRIWHDQTFLKPPWAEPTAFHRDMPNNWSFSAPAGMTVWIALDEATIQNGCLYYVPGSHRAEDRGSNASIRGPVGRLFDAVPELRDEHVVPVPALPGTAIVHNGLTAHAAGANMTPSWRRAMTCQYMPDGATFNGIRSILTSEQVATLAVGDPLDREDHNPLVWREARS